MKNIIGDELGLNVGEIDLEVVVLVTPLQDVVGVC